MTTRPTEWLVTSAYELPWPESAFDVAARKRLQPVPAGAIMSRCG
jgi:hypothetical protein